jgi:hypothetical protein
VIDVKHTALREKGVDIYIYMCELEWALSLNVTRLFVIPHFPVKLKKKYYVTIIFNVLSNKITEEFT